MRAAVHIAYCITETYSSVWRAEVGVTEGPFIDFFGFDFEKYLVDPLKCIHI